MATPLSGLILAALLALAFMHLSAQQGRDPVGDEICGNCQPDTSSATGARQFCKLGNVGRRIPCALEVSPPRPPPVPGDNDGDRIEDAREDALLHRFAPKIWLHHEENRWPVNVEWLLRRSTLRFSHPRCRDHGILSFGAVTTNNITEQTHRNTKDPLTSFSWEACDHHGPRLSSRSHTASPKSSFFLQYTDASHSGSTNPRDWVVYGHVYPTRNGTVVQYWQLYAYNDSFASANHEGDWEFTAVELDGQDVPIRVAYYRHGHTRAVGADRAEWVGDHHVTYVAKGGHAQYRAFETNGWDIPGSCDAENNQDEFQGFADKCGRGTAWSSWAPDFGGIVNVGEKSRPLNGANWLRFSGLWGEIGFSGDVIKFTSGPPGPAYQPDNWNWR
jgi:hypothetical protein